MPPDDRFFFTRSDLILPTGVCADASPRRAACTALFAVGRLKPGVTRAQADADLGAIGERIHQRAPAFVATRPLTVSLSEALVMDHRPGLLLLGAIVCVLLIAAADLASLMLERTLPRHALPGAAPHPGRPLLLESTLLALIAGGLGLLGALALTRLLAAARIDPTTPTDLLIYTGITTIFVTVGLLVTCIPPRRITRDQPASAQTTGSS